MFGKVEGQKLINMTDKNMTEYYLKLSKAQQGRVNTQYLTGATVDPKNLTAWFNNQPYHAAPITINLAHNAILKTLFGEDSHMGITNKPLPFKPETRFHMLQAGNNLGFQLAFNLGFAMAFVAAFYIIVYIKERSTKAKLLQYVSGVNVIVYWVTAFIWDYFTFVITALICLLTLLAFQESGWASFDELGRTFVVLLCFGWAVLPILYLASMMFSVPATGFTRMSIFFIFTGIAMFTVIFSMRFEGFNLKDTAEIMTQVFSVFPHFALSDSFSNLNIINVVRKVCQARCDMLSACDSIEDLCFIPVFSRCCETNYFSYKAPGIGRHLTYMICTGVVVFALLILVELRVFEYLFYKSRHLYKGAPIPLSQDGFVDGDVSAENNRINAMGPDELKTHNLVMKDMTKFYKKFLAVNQLNAAVDPFECFGLLGINGAGKTSTFKMLIGDEKISKGNAWVQGVSLKTNMKEVHKRIGYCPQFDALIDDLTGRETLDFYCLLRGVPKEEIAGVTLKLATELNFMKHIDKLVKEYSGGNKRKLSTAVALIGNPSVIYLDEPTTGMDPGAKRHLWSVICKIRNQGRSIVLTSHSMEECEALCTRLAIMVNGEFKCLGSVQHLKSKFSKGFLLAIKANHREALPRSGSSKSLTRIPSEEGTRVEKIKEFITETFPMAVLKEEFQGLLTYQIPSIDLKWSKIFGTMEKAKGELNIEDYSIGQTSLEQVFLAFAKYQRPEDGD